MAEKIFAPADYGYLDCDAVEIVGSSIPDGTPGEAWEGYVELSGDDSDIALTIEAPDWVSWERDGMTVRLSGTPTEAATDNTITVSASNCAHCGDYSVSETYTFTTCEAIYVASHDLPDGTYGTAWSGSVAFGGTPSLAVSTSSRPSWMSASIGSGIIYLSGTPDGDGTMSVTVKGSNACGEVEETYTFSVCQPAAVSTASFPSATWGSSWTGYVTFVGTDTVNLAVTSVPDWVSYTIGDKRIDFSGTPSGAGVTGTSTVKFTYGNDCQSTATATYTFDVAETYQYATYTSAGTFTVPDGCSCIRVTLTSGEPGAFGFFEIFSSRPSWLYDTVSGGVYTNEDAMGKGSTFGGIDGPRTVNCCYCSDITQSWQLCANYWLPSLLTYSVTYGEWGTATDLVAAGELTDGDILSSDRSFGNGGYAVAYLNCQTATCTAGSYSGYYFTYSFGSSSSQTSASCTPTSVVGWQGDTMATIGHTPTIRGETSLCPTFGTTGTASITDTKVVSNIGIAGASYIPYWCHNVKPGDKYSYTVGDPGKAVYCKDSTFTTSSSNITSSGTSLVAAGTAKGVVCVEWGSVIEDATKYTRTGYHSGGINLDMSTLKPYATASISALRAEQAAKIASGEETAEAVNPNLHFPDGFPVAETPSAPVLHGEDEEGE